MKQCTKCNEFKPETEFHKNPQQKCGLHPWCKTCKRASGRNQKEQNQIRSKQLRKDNPDLVHSYSKKYYDELPKH